MIYYRQRLHSKSAKGKCAWDTVRGEQAQLPRVFSQWCRAECACLPRQQAVTRDACEMSSKAGHGTQAFRVFIGSQVCRHPLPGMYVPRFHTPTRKAGVRHKPYRLQKKNSLGTGSHYQGLVKTLRKPTFPDTSQGSAFLRRAASGLLLSTLFYRRVSF